MNQQSPVGDYAKNIIRSADNWQYYESEIAKILLNKLDQLRQLDVDVHLRTTASKFKEYLGHYQVAIILAHWKGEKVYASDILLPCELTFKLLTDSSDEVDYLRQLIGFVKLNDIIAAVKQDASVELTNLLTETFNELINEYDFSGTDVWEQDIQKRKARNRDYLVQVFGRSLCPGNGVEFFNGLVSAQGFVDRVPNAYNGVLDITICYSVILANMLNRERRNCICISNENELTPSFQLTRLLAICQLMSIKQADFLSALSQVRDIIDGLY